MLCHVSEETEIKVTAHKVPVRCPTRSTFSTHTDFTLETRQDRDELWENWEEKHVRTLFM
jgi:hypothetical protein